MTTGKPVKLYVYRHESEEIIVESIAAKAWDDFLLAEISAEITPEVFDQISQLFSDFSAKMDKQVILVPRGWDIEFYGIREVEDDVDRGQGSS